MGQAIAVEQVEDMALCLRGIGDSHHRGRFCENKRWQIRPAVDRKIRQHGRPTRVWRDNFNLVRPTALAAIETSHELALLHGGGEPANRTTGRREQNLWRKEGRPNLPDYRSV